LAERFVGNRSAIQQHREAAWGVVSGKQAGKVSHAGRLDSILKLAARGHSSVGIPDLNNPVAVDLDSFVSALGLPFARRSRPRDLPGRRDLCGSCRGNRG
jgi:hypothetical protein